MSKKTMVFGLLFYALLASPLAAANVSFVVIEIGLSEGSPTSQYTILWENSLLAVFFDSGHIVSNAPKIRLAETPVEDFPYEAERDFSDAKDGGMKYFLVAVVDHRTPHNVSLRAFSTKTHQLIQKHVYEDKATKTKKEEQENINKTIWAMASQLQ
jgi:hypothetical protein